MKSPRVEGLRREGLVMAERIADCILRAGGEPVLLVPSGTMLPAERIASFDGLLLPGGRDVDPGLYTDEPRHPMTQEPDAEQDAADLGVLRAAVESGLPTFAICRGMQVVNVALGGTLAQHLDGDTSHANAMHEVVLAPESRILGIMGSAEIRVSSYHHQAVERVAPGLVVTGRASDGIPEVLEHHTAPVLSVQWHPEDNAHEAPEQQALFDDLVDRARHRRRRMEFAS
jgi:putative glutamine amidotransferase